MKTAATALLETLFSAGAKVRVEDGQLWVKAKPGVITADLRKSILELKPELLKIMTTHHCSRCDWGVFSEPTVCFHCRQAIAEEKAREALIAELDGRQEVAA